ncbi:MAG: tetratricopeptide repeat protein, partial [Acidobacteriota bacterium]
ILESLRIAQEIDDSKAIVRALTLLGRSNDFLSRYDDAIRNYQNGIELAESHGYPAELILLYHRLGVVYAITGKRGQGLSLCLKAVALAESTGDQAGLAGALGQAGVIYLLSKDYERAQETVSRALAIGRELNDPQGVAGALSNLGIIARNQGRLADALNHQTEALEYYLELGETRAIASAYDRLGRIHSDLNEPDKALDYHLKALELKESIEDRRGVAATLASIRDIHRGQGNFEKALEYFDRYWIASQEVFNSENRKRIDELQTRFEVESTARENSYLRRSNRLQLYAFLAFSLLLIVIAATIFTHYRLKSRANTQALSRQRLRGAIGEMRSARDWPSVARTLDSLLEKTLTCEHSAFLLMNLHGGQWALFSVGGTFGEKALEKPPSSRPLEYPNWRLTRADHPSGLGQWSELAPAGTKTLLTAPFRGGVLIVSSPRKNAFRKTQCQSIADLAQILSIAHQRLEDLKEIENRQTMLRQAQRMEALGFLTTGIAHHFNNLMQVILGNLSLLENKVALEFSPIIADMRTAGDRIAAMVNELMIFSKRSHSPRPRQIALADIINRVVEREDRIDSSRVQLTTQISSQPTVWGNAQQLEQLLRNLITNAEEAVEEWSPASPAVTVTLDTEACPPESTGWSTGNDYLAVLKVVDNGVGMDSITLSRAFDPFFTTRGPDRAGLGLSTVYSLVEQLGGRVELSSSPGKGTVIKVSLPVWARDTGLKRTFESDTLQ